MSKNAEICTQNGSTCFQILKVVSNKLTDIFTLPKITLNSQSAERNKYVRSVCRELLAGEKKPQTVPKHILELDSGNGIPMVPVTGQTVSVIEAAFARKP